jgi:RNA polymerase sigma-70 factor (ECF subfamily)
MAWTTRKSLIERILDGDEESWGTFYATYSRLVYAIGERSGLSADDCEDLVQEVMRTIFNNKDRFRYDSATGKFRTYLTGIVKHKVYDFYRKRDGRIVAVEDEIVLEAAEPVNRLDDVCTEEWKNHLLNVALMELREKVDPGTFDAFQMYVLQERQPREVADALSISESAVYVYKNRCVSHLRSIIGKYRNLDPEFCI